MTREKENVSQDIPIPQILVESYQREHGIILMVGNRNSSVEKTLEFLFHRYKKNNNNSCVYISRDEQPAESFKQFFHICTYGNRSAPAHLKFLKEASVVILENIQHEEELSAAVNLYEEGRLVILHLSAPSLISALHRICDLALRTQNSHLLWRVVDGLTLLFNQTKISQAETVFAHEVVLVSPEVKKCLWLGELKDFEELTKNAGEHSGILTLNQSLLQLLIRRKIEIKTAFEISRDPVDLDQLLKKVGV